MARRAAVEKEPMMAESYTSEIVESSEGMNYSEPSEDMNSSEQVTYSDTPQPALTTRNTAPLPSPKVEENYLMGSPYGVDQIAAALVRAKRNLGKLRKDATNPAFKNKYASLAATYESFSDALLAEDVVDIQTFEDDPLYNETTGEFIRERHMLVTTLIHAPSGQTIRSRLELKPVDNKPQTLGSLTTYYRRYMLQSLIGIAPEDDDGNIASGSRTNSLPTTVESLGPNVTKLRAVLKERGIQGSRAASDELKKVGYTGDFLAIDEKTAADLLEKIALF